MILGLIPSRLNSKRLKNKPLLRIDGLPIIIHTLKRAMMSKKLDKVIVCTDSPEVVDLIKKNGGEALLTSTNHKNGTERIYEVAKKYKTKLIVDIQGDEPLVDPKDIDKVIDFHLKNNNFDIVLPSMISKDPNPKNIVKVIFNKKNRVLYFSRSKIPFNYLDKKNFQYFKDLSIVSFKPKALAQYTKLEMGKLEKQESIELLRALENNLSIGTFVTTGTSFSVDVNDDLLKAIDVMPRDKYRKYY